MYKAIKVSGTPENTKAIITKLNLIPEDFVFFETTFKDYYLVWDFELRNGLVGIYDQAKFDRRFHIAELSDSDFVEVTKK